MAESPAQRWGISVQDLAIEEENPFMKLLKFLDERLEEIFLVMLMAAAVIIVAMQVITRYLLKVPLPWSEEIARYMFLWLTWVGASFATKEGRHVSIDVIYQKLPPNGQLVCSVIFKLVWLGFLIVMARLSLKLTASVYSGGQIAVGSGLPMWIPYASVPVGMTMMLFRLIQNFYRDIKAFRSRKEGVQ